MIREDPLRTNEYEGHATCAGGSGSRIEGVDRPDWSTVLHPSSEIRLPISTEPALCCACACV